MVESTCGICTFENMALCEIRKCSICQGHLCMPLQNGPRTICSNCILEASDNYGKIFVDGRIDGNWIDPATKLPIPTCQKSETIYTNDEVFGLRLFLAYN